MFQQDIEEVSIQAKDFESFSADSLSGFDMASIQPHENDVLMGRGGKNNQHSGNETLREIARIHCEEYRLSTKKGKSQISRNLVQYMRDLDPPARYVHACHMESVDDNDGTILRQTITVVKSEDMHAIIMM